MTNTPNNHYIYIWKEQGVAGSGLPFYVGQGTHMKGTKYFRSTERHVGKMRGLNRKEARPLFCQRKADKLARLGVPHVVEILHDNLTQEEAKHIEVTLIRRLGRRDLNTGILCNLTVGGESTIWDSPVVRENHLKAVRSEANRDRVSKWASERLKDPDILQKHIDTLNEHRKTKEVIHGGVKYESVAELSRILGLNPMTVGKRIREGKDPSKDYSGYNKKEIEYDGKIYGSMTELAKEYGMSYPMLAVRLESGIPLEAPHHTKKVMWDGIEYKSVRAIAEKLGWSLNAVKARVKDGVFTYSELTPRNVKR